MASHITNPEFTPRSFSAGSDNTGSAPYNIDTNKEGDIPPIEEVSEMDQSSASAYTLACDQSLYCRQVDQFSPNPPTEIQAGLDRMLPIAPTPGPMAGDAHATGLRNTDYQERVPLVQRSTLVSSTSIDASRIWYMLAMILPLFSVNNTSLWCTPSNMVNAADVFMHSLRQFCAEVRIQAQRFAEDRLARDFFATLLDIVLVIYAIGFLFLSLYQASVFG